MAGPAPGRLRPVIRATSACARVRRRARCTLRPYRQPSTAAVSVPSSAAAPSAASKAALLYKVGAHAVPVTERQTASARLGQPVIAARTRNCRAATAEATALTMAVSQAASPSRALMPRAVSRVSSSGASQATASA